MEHFITEINIKQVRHIENLKLNLSEQNKKHLILTGKNGSGKTSVLEALMRNLKGIENGEMNYYHLYNAQLKEAQKEYDKENIDMLKYELEKDISSVKNKINYYIEHLETKINYTKDITNKFINGEFILAFFGADRKTSFIIPNEIKNVSLNYRYNIEENISNIFLNYLVYLKTQQSFARNENDIEAADNIQKWFDNLEKALKELLEDESIKLFFDYKNLMFKLKQKNRRDYCFDELPSGYLSVLDILINLILRMERTKTNSYDVEGIVIIDEVETHLHIDLQKKIMPFFTTFFPKIQFIVSTHSPFILNSLENVVVYDLENQIRIENLSGYSYEGIVEGYFDISQYSDKIINKLERYNDLVEKEYKSQEEEDEELELRRYLKGISSELAPEVTLAFNKIEIVRKSKLKNIN